MDGSHTIERAAAVTQKVLAYRYQSLADNSESRGRVEGGGRPPLPWACVLLEMERTLSPPPPDVLLEGTLSNT
jgi:hypothetical protein